MTVFYFILGGSYPLKFTQLTFGKEHGQCQKKTKMTVSRSQEARLEVLDSLSVRWFTWLTIHPDLLPER